MKQNADQLKEEEIESFFSTTPRRLSSSSSFILRKISLVSSLLNRRYDTMPFMNKGVDSLIFKNRLIFILSLVGIAIAVYVFQSFIRQTPIVCVNTGCEIVRKNPASYLFGVPVPAFGLIGYAILAMCSFLRTMNQKPQTMKFLLNIIFGVSTFGLLFVSWFTYTELFVIRAVCTWCAISAANMVIIFLLAFFSLRSTIKKDEVKSLKFAV